MVYREYCPSQNYQCMDIKAYTKALLKRGYIIVWWNKIKKDGNQTDSLSIKAIGNQKKKASQWKPRIGSIYFSQYTLFGLSRKKIKETYTMTTIIIQTKTLGMYSWWTKKLFWLTQVSNDFHLAHRTRRHPV